MKSGCKTCKYVTERFPLQQLLIPDTCDRARYVKCDEIKPICHRCEKSGYMCDGYEEAFVKSSTKLRPGPILPYLFPAPTPNSTPFLTVSFDNNVDRQYFQVYLEQLLPQLSGAFPFPIRTQIVLQACYSESFIRDGVVALAELSLSSTRERKPITEKNDALSVCITTVWSSPSQHKRINIKLYKHSKELAHWELTGFLF